MLLAFQSVLLVIIIITFIGCIGEESDKGLRNNLTALCIASIIGFALATWFL